jgi:enoyl-CoA hydratase/carnithine racemase
VSALVPPLVVTEREGAVLVVRLARPEKKNALTLAMYTAITAAFRQAREDDAIHALLLLGAPGAFTSGNDIADFMASPPSGPDSPVFGFLEALSTFPKPLVMGVDGPAIGVGTTMLLHADLVIASTRSRFQMPFVDLGLVAEGASSVLLPERVGLALASRWLLLGESFDAETARASGLLSEVVDPAALEDRARSLAQALAAKPVEAVRITKQLLREPQREAVQRALHREGDAFVARLASPETAAAFMAFMSRKR